jgi:large subunit ribosomal protein L30
MAEEKRKRIAVVRVRGTVHVSGEIGDTLDMLGLRRVNQATVIDDRPTYMGMVKKAKDFITWGEADEKVLARLIAKWGRLPGDKRVDKETLKSKGFSSFEDFAKRFCESKAEFKDLGIKSCFKLHPPSRGYERGGIKRHFSVGGALGYRGEGINDLLIRMSGLKDGSKEQKNPKKEGQ